MFGRSDTQPQNYKDLGYEDDMRYNIPIFCFISFSCTLSVSVPAPRVTVSTAHFVPQDLKALCELQQIHPIPLGAEITIDAYIDSPKSPEYLPARLTWNV